VPRSRYDARFVAAGAAIAAAAVGARVAGVAGFDPYPELSLDSGAATLALSVALPPLAAFPFARSHV
jgi:hypothetical protein